MKCVFFHHSVTRAEWQSSFLRAWLGSALFLLRAGAPERGKTATGWWGGRAAEDFLCLQIVTQCWEHKGGRDRAASMTAAKVKRKKKKGKTDNLEKYKSGVWEKTVRCVNPDFNLNFLQQPFHHEICNKFPRIVLGKCASQAGSWGTRPCPIFLRSQCITSSSFTFSAISQWAITRETFYSPSTVSMIRQQGCRSDKHEFKCKYDQHWTFY